MIFRIVATLALLCVLPSTAKDEPKDDSRRHFIAGLQAAQFAEYEAALQHFLNAQQAYPHPNTLFNIARAYQDLGQLQQAIEYYRSFRPPNLKKRLTSNPSLRSCRRNWNNPTTDTESPTSPASIESGDFERLKALSIELQNAIDALNVHATTPDSGVSTDTTTTSSTIDGEGFRDNAYERVVVTASRYGQDP